MESLNLFCSATVYRPGCQESVLKQTIGTVPLPAVVLVACNDHILTTFHIHSQQIPRKVLTGNFSFQLSPALAQLEK